jgi:hypothetical protein
VSPVVAATQPKGLMMMTTMMMMMMMMIVASAYHEQLWVRKQFSNRKVSQRQLKLSPLRRKRKQVGAI